MKYIQSGRRLVRQKEDFIIRIYVSKHESTNDYKILMIIRHNYDKIDCKYTTLPL